MSKASLPERLTIEPGGTTILNLPGHGVGGYVWSAAVDPVLGHIEQMPAEPGDNEAIGGGRTARFRLTWHGEKPGVVTFQLQRPWEDHPVERRRVEVLLGES